MLRTETDWKFRGEGVAGQLASASLDDARKQGLGVLPFCPYAWDWIASHAEYADIVPPARRREFGLMSEEGGFR